MKKLLTVLLFFCSFFLFFPDTAGETVGVSVKVLSSSTEVPSYLIGARYSMGYKRLSISPPYAWYWGWDYFNCNPETSKDIYGKSCGSPDTEPFSYGPYGGYRINFGYPSIEGLLAHLDRAKDMKISPLQTGKSIWISGPVFATSDGASVVNPSVTIECTPTYTAHIPIWSAQTNTYLKWIADTAKTIKDHPSLKFITITHGIDGEGYFIRYDDCKKALEAKIAADPTFPNPLAGVDGYVKSVTAAYYKNFCSGLYDEAKQVCDGTMKTIFEQKTTWGDALGQNGLYTPPMGIKFNAYTADTPQAVIYHNAWRGWGTVESYVRYRNMVPTSVEPRHGNFFLGGEQGTYWFGLHAIWMRPTNIDINPNYGLWGKYEDDPDYYNLINDHLNVSAATTPDVWIAFRDTDDLCGAKNQADYNDNICVTKSNNGSGIRGDYDFFLKRPDNLPSNKTVLLRRLGFNKDQYFAEIPGGVIEHKFSRYVRRTDAKNGSYYMSFDVDNDYPWANKPGQSFEVTVSYLDLGTGDFYVEYKNGQGILIKKPVGRGDTKVWKTVKVAMDDAYFADGLGLGEDGNGAATHTDFRIYNGGPSLPNVYLHMVKVRGLGGRLSISKNRTEVVCNTPGTTVLKGETAQLLVSLRDRSGNALSDKAIRYTIDPYWYTNRIGYVRTDEKGGAVAQIETSDLPLASNQRFVHEVEVSFPGDDNYFGSSALCYLPLDYARASRRTITATTSLKEARIGDFVTVDVNVGGGGGGSFTVEGEGFGMPACSGDLDSSGRGSCGFKIGGMAIAGERVIGVYVTANGVLGGASTHLVLKVVDDGEVEPTFPTSAPGPIGATATPSLVPSALVSPTGTIRIALNSGWNEVVWQSNYPTDKRFSVVPDGCSVVETADNGFWRIFVRNYGGEDLTFERGKSYGIRCQNSAVWNF